MPLLQQIIVSMIIVASLTACRADVPAEATSSPAVEAAPSAGIMTLAQGQRLNLTFEQSHGQVVVVARPEAVEFVVALDGLDPRQDYEIALETRPEGGAMFDKYNAHLEVGLARGETVYVPDAAGSIRLRETHPLRLIHGKAEAWIVVHQATIAWTMVDRSPAFMLE